MTYSELVSVVKAHNASLPASNPSWISRFLGKENRGPGIHRSYTIDDARRLIGWHRLGCLIGHDSSIQTKMRYEAVSLYALNRQGWVVMSRGDVWWQAYLPVQALRDGAVCLPCEVTP